MKLHTLFIYGLCAFLLSSCSSYKKIPYLQDADMVKVIKKPHPMQDAKIMPKDLLAITVNTTDPEAAAPFNMNVQSSGNGVHSTSSAQQAAPQQYLVSHDGCINFPVLGRLQVSGLTKSEAESLIREKVGAYLKETPIVTVRMTNYKISVLGEVAKPGMFTINNEKVNIFEALALAGDLTIWGMRDNVKLIREDAEGQIEVVYLNLNNVDLMSSPYYYLQQNDILYVTPNKTKAKNSDVGQNTSFWFSAASILVSIASTIVTLLILK